MTPIKPPCWIIIGVAHLVSVSLSCTNHSNSLKVPAVRSVLEFVKFVTQHLFYTPDLHKYDASFLTLFVLFVLTLEFSELNNLNWIEISFMVYALGSWISLQFFP